MPAWLKVASVSAPPAKSSPNPFWLSAAFRPTVSAATQRSPDCGDTTGPLVTVSWKPRLSVKPTRTPRTSPSRSLVMV